jgi:hypothetical protein
MVIGGILYFCSGAVKAWARGREDDLVLLAREVHHWQRAP